MDITMRAGLVTLMRELGYLRGLLVILGVGWRLARGEPFRSLNQEAQAALEPSAGHLDRERENRAQIAPVINIYNTLRRRVSEEEALRITGAVVIAGGRAFLSHTLRELNDTEALLNTSRSERVERLTQLLAPVPNALFELSIDDQDHVHYTVTSCRFVQLCHQLGYPELAPLFCAVDDYFFREDMPSIHLERATTLARGGERCPFVLRLEPSSSGGLVQIKSERARAREG